MKWKNEGKKREKNKAEEEREQKEEEAGEEENKNLLHSQKISEVTVKLAMVLHAGSQDIHCKKTAKENMDKGPHR